MICLEDTRTRPTTRSTSTTPITASSSTASTTQYTTSSSTTIKGSTGNIGHGIYISTFASNDDKELNLILFT